MPITQVGLNVTNQAYLKDMLLRLAPGFCSKPFTVNDQTLNHSTRGIFHIAQIVYRTIPEKMEEAGLSGADIFPQTSMDVNGYTGYLYRLFKKHF